MGLYLYHIYHETETGIVSLGVHIPPEIPILTLNFDSTESKSCPQNPVQCASRQAANVSSRIQTWVLYVEVLVRIQDGCDEEKRRTWRVNAL